MVNADFVAGISAGAVTTMVMHPLDLIKVRLQVDDYYHPSSASSKRPSMTGHVTRIINSCTSYRDLYRGLTVNLVGNTVSWGLYFALYNELKRTLIVPIPKQDNTQQQQQQQQQQHLYLACALVAGTTTSFLTNPLWVLKTRLLGTPSSLPSSSSLLKIVRSEGIKTLWRGFIPGLFGVVQGSLQFTIYEDLKQRRRHAHHQTQAQDQNHQLPVQEYLAISAISKTLATVLLYPYQLVRSRMQMPPPTNPTTIDAATKQKRVSALQVLKTTVKTEGGVFALYKGLGANLLRVVPSTCITFLVYEKVQLFMSSR